MKQIRDINRSNRQNEKDNEEWMVCNYLEIWVREQGALKVIKTGTIR